jgi:hypothetical protein
VRAALRRNTFIAACAFGLVMAVGLVAVRRDAARTPPAEQQTKPAAVQPRIPAGAMKGEQTAAPASGADSSAAKPVIINLVTPWIEIARRSQYVQASSAERRAIRDLYWNICVEEKIPLEQRESAYWQFVRDWESAESGASGTATRTPSLSQYLQKHQAVVPSPVDAGTMRLWCKR